MSLRVLDIDALSAERLREYGQWLVTYGDGEYDLMDNLLDCPEAKHDNKQARDLVKELVIRFDKSQNLTPSGTVTNKKLRARKLISLSQLCSSRCLVVGFVTKGVTPGSKLWSAKRFIIMEPGNRQQKLLPDWRQPH